MTFTDDSADRPPRRVGGVPEVPGVSVRSRLRDAGAGEHWAGQFDRTGIECVVRRVRLAPDPVLRSAAVTAARALAELEHPHLVPVVAVLPTADGLALVTEPVVGGVSLARLLAARGALDPGEVVTIGLPVAQALAAAHAAGIVHGRLEREDILLEPNGRPVLVGVGVAALADAARADPVPPEAASADVHDLATLLLSAMREATGPDAAAVAVAVATALIDDPWRRPSAVELAAVLARSAMPLPVRLTAEEGTPGDASPAAAGLTGSPTETLPTIPRIGSPADPPGARPTAPRDPPGADRHRPGAGDGGRADDAGRAARDRRRRPSAASWPGPASPGEPGPDVAPPEPAPPPGDGDGFPPAEGGSRPPDRAVTGATAVDAAELLDLLPPPPRRSTRSTRSTGAGRRSGRGAGRGGSPAAPEPSSPGPAEPRGGGKGSGRSASAGPGGPGSASGPAAVDRPGPSGPSGPSGRDRPGGAAGRRSRPGAGPRSRRTGTRRRRLVLPVTAGLGLLAVVVAVALLMRGPSGDESTTAERHAPAASGGAREPTASPVTGQSPQQVWRAVLTGLDVARSRAFEQADEAALQESDAVGSPLLASDVELMHQMVAKSAHASALRTEIIDLEIRVDQPDRAVLRVTQRLGAYDFLDANGAVLAHQPAKQPERRDLTLVRTESGWRVSDNVVVTG